MDYDHAQHVKLALEYGEKCFKTARKVLRDWRFYRGTRKSMIANPAKLSEAEEQLQTLIQPLVACVTEYQRLVNGNGKEAPDDLLASRSSVGALNTPGTP